MQSSSKRTVQVNVKMSVEDFEMFKRAADALWPNAVLTNSSIVLGLAKLGSSRQNQAIQNKAQHEKNRRSRTS